MNLGKNILAIRKRNGLSLQELAERTGVSRSMLSKIEREEKNPTVQIACQIAEGLELTLSQLLGEQSEKEVVVIPKAKRVIYHDEASGFERHLLSPAFPSKGMELVLNKIPPHSSSGVFPKHKQGVKEYITVITGNLTANLGDKSFFLSEGDSIYFEADLEHEFKNEHDVFCEYILVIDSYGIK